VSGTFSFLDIWWAQFHHTGCGRRVRVKKFVLAILLVCGVGLAGPELLLDCPTTVSNQPAFAMNSLPEGSWSGAGTYYGRWTGSTPAPFQDILLIKDNVITLTWPSKVPTIRPTVFKIKVEFGKNGFIQTSTQDNNSSRITKGTGYCTNRLCHINDVARRIETTFLFSGNNIYQLGSINLIGSSRSIEPSWFDAFRSQDSFINPPPTNVGLTSTAFWHPTVASEWGNSGVTGVYAGESGRTGDFKIGYNLNPYTWFIAFPHSVVPDGLLGLNISTRWSGTPGFMTALPSTTNGHGQGYCSSFWCHFEMVKIGNKNLELTVAFPEGKNGRLDLAGSGNIGVDQELIYWNSSSPHVNQ
jgi:hypothetical protein